MENKRMRRSYDTTSVVRKGAWTAEEDMLLKNCIDKFGEGKWHLVPLRAGLNRCRKSCRLRWLNYLRPNIKRGDFAEDEVDLTLRLHKLLGNRWSLIAGRIPGRTANDVKNYWNTHLKSRCKQQKEQLKEGEQSPPTMVTIIKPQPCTISKALNLRPHVTSHDTHNLITSSNIAFLKRLRTDYFPPETLGEECVSATTVVDEEAPAETNIQTANANTSLLIAVRQPISHIKRLWADYFLPGRLGEECIVMSGSVSANGVVEQIVNEELPVDTNSQTANVYRSALIAASRSISHIKRLWADNFPPGRFREESEMMPVSVSANPVVEPNIVEELPAVFPVIAARRLIAFLKRLWTHYLEEEGVMSPKLAFKVVILGLFGFAEIRFQGGTGSPFQTHPRISMVSVTSMIMYGLVSYVLSAARLAPNSVYAFTARLVGKLCFIIFVGTLASLFYL